MLAYTCVRLMFCVKQGISFVHLCAYHRRQPSANPSHPPPPPPQLQKTSLSAHAQILDDDSDDEDGDEDDDDEKKEANKEEAKRKESASGAPPSQAGDGRQLMHQNTGDSEMDEAAPGGAFGKLVRMGGGVCEWVGGWIASQMVGVRWKGGGGVDSELLSWTMLHLWGAFDR